MKKIEIHCTKKQKGIIIDALLSPCGCLWPQHQLECANDPDADCRKCFEKNIKWMHPKAKPQASNRPNAEEAAAAPWEVETDD